MEIAAHDEAQHSCGDVLTPQDTNEKLTVTELRAAISVETSEHLTDSDCLRFLRARNHDVAKASVMINHWAEWWYKPLPGTEDTEQPIRPKDAFAIPDKKEHIYREMLPHSNLGEGKYGHPVYWERTGLISSQFHEVKKHLTEDDIFNRHIRQQELMVARMKKASERHGKDIEKQLIVMDLKGVAMTVDFMAMRAFKRTLHIDEACYPERLHKLLMINAPSTFTFLWAVVRPWLHPVTAEKIQIVGSNYHDVLKEHIDEHQIPVEYGGTKEEFHWTFPENLQM